MRVFAIAAMLATTAMAESFSGHWEGTIQIPEHEFAISVDMAKDAAGAWIGSMSVLKSSSIDVPVARIAVEGKTIRFSANLPEEALFEGALSDDDRVVSGKASSRQGDAPFRMERKGEAEVKIPPASTALPGEFAGEWEASLAGKILKMKLAAGDDGKARGVLITGDGLEIPASTVAIRAGELRLEARAVSGAFSGRLSESEIAGEWVQGDQKLELRFHRR